MEKRSRGTTLIEAMVYCSIFGMVLACIYGTLVSSTRYFYAADALNQATQSAQTGIAQLVNELTESHPSTVVLGSTSTGTTNQNGIIFASPRDEAGIYQRGTDGKAIWQKFVCYYTGTDGDEPVLIRREVAISPSADPPENTHAIADFSGNAGLRTRIVARNITGMTVSGTGTISIVINSTVEKLNKVSEASVRTQVKLRNQ